VTEPSAKASKVVEADICIVGAGPAGLTLARQCIGWSNRVLLLEGGHDYWDLTAQSLRSSTVESEYYNRDALSVGRRRQFGGTANNWSHVTQPNFGGAYARALPAESVDFEHRSWQPDSGWPFDLRELMPYYDRVAQSWIGGPVDTRPSTWQSANRPPLPLRSGPLHTRMAQYGTSEAFLRRYRADIIASNNVDTQLDSTVVKLDADYFQTEIKLANVQRADGSRYQVRAKVFVLAGGTVENVQTLLNSAATQPGAPGNQHDNIGRYVTDHPEFLLGTIDPAHPELVDQIGLYDMHYVGDKLVSGLITFDEEFKRAERLLNVAAVLLPRPAGFGTPAERALRVLAMSGQRVRPSNLKHLGTVVTSPRDAAAVMHNRLVRRHSPNRDYPDGYVWHRGGWSRPGVDRSQLTVLEVHVATEQSPERSNQLLLTAQRDGVGRQHVKLRMHWSADDQTNLLRTMDALAAEVEGSRLGRFRPWIDFHGATRPINHGLHHPMGGARMHADPRLGVVDENCRVHGISNLYIAGSAVFPTGLGYANPTLTLLALSSRLADHLVAVLSRATLEPLS